MSEFKTEWMTGIFRNPDNVSQLLLANIEALRPVRLDKLQEEVIFSVEQKGGAVSTFSLISNQEDALTNIFFDSPNAWLKSERKRVSFAEIQTHREGIYEFALTSKAGLPHVLEKIELVGNTIIASFLNRNVGTESYKISLGSVNTNIAPLQQIHDSKNLLSENRLSGLLLQPSSGQNGTPNFVRPTRPGLGQHYYRKPDSPSLYLNASTTNVPIQDNASAGMQDVVATAAIFQNHDKLPGLGEPNPQPLHELTTNDEGKILLSVVFSHGDEQLGLSAGSTSLLKSNPNNNPKKSFYLPPVPNRDVIGQSFVFKGFKLDNNKPSGLDVSNTLWFTAKDDLFGILSQKQEQFSVDIPFDSRNSQSPAMRVASALGMRDFNNAYVATLEVDPRVVFRPKGAHNIQGPGGHKVTNLEIGVPVDSSGNVALVKDQSGQYWVNNVSWSEDWDPLYKDTYQGFFTTEKDNQGKLNKVNYAKFSDFYSDWWANNLQDPLKTNSGGIKPIDDVGFAFPWTGVGYTFDYYDQLNAGSQNPTPQGRGAGEMVLLPNANYTDQQMIDKFGPGVNPWEYEVQNIQTINQFLKNSTNQADEFPGLDLTGSDSAELTVNLKRLGMNANTLYIYECDPITGKIWTGNMENPDSSKLNEWLDPNADASQYQQAIVKQGNHQTSDEKMFDVHKIDASEMPAYKRSKDLSFKLDSTKNWGLLLQRPGSGGFASSYDSVDNPFIVMAGNSFSGTQPSKAGEIAVAYGVEDIKLSSSGCDFDFNDIIVTMEYAKPAV